MDASDVDEDALRTKWIVGDCVAYDRLDLLL
jgi:hypothetical protein